MKTSRTVRLKVYFTKQRLHLEEAQRRKGETEKSCAFADKPSSVGCVRMAPNLIDRKRRLQIQTVHALDRALCICELDVERSALMVIG